MKRLQIEARVPMRGQQGDHVYSYTTTAHEDDQHRDIWANLRQELEERRFIWIETQFHGDVLVAVEHIVNVETIDIEPPPLASVEVR